MMSTGIQVLYLFARVIFMIGLTTHKMTALQVVLVVKNPFANAGDIREMGSLGQEGMATHSSILAWRIPMDRRAWQATVHSVAKSWT